MALHVIYRSYGGENLQTRPSYYSKLTCLLSFIKAVEHTEFDVTFLNDGPIPPERLEVMQRLGTVVSLKGSGMRKSYLSAIELAIDGRWAPQDFVYFCEDDYLYTRESFDQLGLAVQSLREVAYFTLYGSTTEYPLSSDLDRPIERPRGWQDDYSYDVDGMTWSRIQSTTSTFGGRVFALRQDLRIFKLCMLPHRKSLRDHDTCLVYQGFEPHSYAQLMKRACGAEGDTFFKRLRKSALVPFLLATNLRSHRRRSRRRLLVAPSPNLSTHAQVGLIATGTDWTGIASAALPGPANPGPSEIVRSILQD